MRPTAVVPMALIMLALAGCSDPKGGADEEVFDDLELEATSTTGIIRGVVVDDAIRPLAGATVVLRAAGDQPEQSTSTPDTGVFAFDGLPAGGYFLFVAKPGYVGVQASADVVAGIEEPPIVKVALALDASFVAPYFEQFIFEGFMECGAGAAVEGVVFAYDNTCSRSVPGQAPPFPNANTQGVDVVSGYPDWVQAEMVWQSTQSFGTWLGHNFHYTDGGEADGQKDLAVQGPSPLVNTMDKETAKEYLEGLDFEEGSELRLQQRIFTRAPDGTGPAVTYQQRFTVYTTVFYGYVPPEGWTFHETSEVPPPPS